MRLIFILLCEQVSVNFIRLLFKLSSLTIEHDSIFSATLSFKVRNMCFHAYLSVLPLRLVDWNRLKSVPHRLFFGSAALRHYLHYRSSVSWNLPLKRRKVLLFILWGIGRHYVNRFKPVLVRSFRHYLISNSSCFFSVNLSFKKHSHFDVTCGCLDFSLTVWREIIRV